MNLSLAEVYEVATFYHHFHVLRDDEAAPNITVRVCDSLAFAQIATDEITKTVVKRNPPVLIFMRRMSFPCPHEHPFECQYRQTETRNEPSVIQKHSQQSWFI
ncbi:MAG: hypothetical protein EBW25_03240 [Actinobacteria bacterium]|nr:hypothetical protein [Actinomycetota bacterium]